MHYNYYFELCSLIFLTVLATGYYMRKKFPIPVFKLFGVCIGVVIVNVSLNIAGSVLLDTPNVSTSVHEAVNELYYFTQVFLSYLLFAYVFYGVGKSLKYSPQYYLTTLPSIAFGIIVFSNAGHHLFFTLEEYAPGLYNIARGPLYFLIYVISGLNVFSTLVYTIYFRKKLSKKSVLVLFGVVGIVSSAIIIQYWFPEYLLAGLSYTLSMIIAVVTVNDPDEKVDRISKAFNNDAFVEYINNQRFERQRKHYIAFEVESFGMFNKMFGHLAANQLLSTIRKIVETINKKAYIFKTKSSRFVILLRNREEQIEMVDSLKEKFSHPILVGNKEMSVSIKLFYFVNEDVFKNSDSYDDFIYHLLPMINFKDTNYVELDKEFLDRIHRDRKIKEILENCLKTNTGLYMVYQPIYDVKTKSFNHFEALIRLANNELGYVGPSEFVPIAESAGLANAIDNFVFEETCAFLSRNPQVETLEINISCAEFFNNPSSRYINTIEKFNIDPKRICLEITETIAVKYPEKTKEFMADLGQYGVQFAMDDFGSGYSNIARFIALPFSLAKLDKTLLEDSPNIRIFLDSAINLFKNLNIPIVIEGVETEDQLKLAKEKDIDYVQGYYFSRPLEEESLIDFLKKHSN